MVISVLIVLCFSVANFLAFHAMENKFVVTCVRIRKKYSQPEIGRQCLFAFVRLFSCVPAHDISLSVIFWAGIGWGKNKIIMARTVKID